MTWSPLRNRTVDLSLPWTTSRLLSRPFSRPDLQNHACACLPVSPDARQWSPPIMALIALGAEACTLLEAVTDRIDESWRSGGTLARDAVAHIISSAGRVLLRCGSRCRGTGRCTRRAPKRCEWN
jgi:hypothetical protein